MRIRLVVLVIAALLAPMLNAVGVPVAAAPLGSDWLQTTAPPFPPTNLRFGQLTATSDGRILSLVLGGNARGSISLTSLYDLATEGWSAAQELAIKQGAGAPVSLADGRILLTGGTNSPYCLPQYCPAYDTAQVFDPSQNRWSSVAPMPVARLGHCAERLRDGTVLVFGGYYTAGSHSYPRVTNTVRYDPRTDRWTEAAPREIYGCQSLTLADGRVVVLGTKREGGATVEIYDTLADHWSTFALPPSLLADLNTNYPSFTPLPLPDGRVLVIRNGAAHVEAAYVPKAAIYDPQVDRWSDAPAPTFGAAALTPLTDGRILATGSKIEQYDPAENRWSVLPAPEIARVWGNFTDTDSSARLSWAVAPLADGRALLTAGDNALVLGDPARPRACFAETGKCLSGRFLTYWQANGGLAANGFPLTGPITEELEDGRTYTVQYLERVRLEHHPENPTPHDILLGQFGRRIHPLDPPAAPLPGQRFFPETGHNLGGPYLAHWEANGGLPRFGYPLSEVITETLEDGKAYRVQYFERARLEYHPENPTPFDILGGQFGRRILQENRWLAEAPALKSRYITDSKLQAALGPLRGPITFAPVEFQEFEYGAVLLTGYDFDSAYVLCNGSPLSGTSVTTVSRRGLPGPQAAPQPPAGRYVPINGIGDLWLRSTAARECLGYATSPIAPTTSTMMGIFERGLLLNALAPRGMVYYALYGETDTQGNVSGERYEQLPPSSR